MGKDGKVGGTNPRHGKAFHYAVPIGTSIYKINKIKKVCDKTQQIIDDVKLKKIGELLEKGDELRIVRGGKGGNGTPTLAKSRQHKRQIHQRSNFRRKRNRDESKANSGYYS